MAVAKTKKTSGKKSTSKKSTAKKSSTKKTAAKKSTVKKAVKTPAAKTKKTTTKAATTVKKSTPSSSKSSSKKKSSSTKVRFKINDKVVYSQFGVGTIVDIQKKDINGRKEDYYIINLLSGGMNVMIPISKSKEIGLRPVVSMRNLKKVFDILKSKTTKMDDDWKTRYQANFDQIKTGSIYEVAEVARNYHKRNQEKELSIMEKKLYETACQLIVNEVSVIKNIDREEAERIVFDTLR